MDPRLHYPVELWLVTLGSGDMPSPSDLVDAEDRSRGEQILLPARRRQFTFRRRVLRYVLSRYLPRYSLEFEVGGKPVVRTRSGRMGLQFSTSSSRDVCAVCVGGTAETGVDVEANPLAVDIAEVMARFVPGPALSELPGGLAATAGERTPELNAFRQHLAVMSWCRLEAYTKLHGRTLHQVLFEDPERLLLPAFAKDDHHVVALANLDCVCVIAQRQPFHVARVHQIDFARIAHEQA